MNGDINLHLCFYRAKPTDPVIYFCFSLNDSSRTIKVTLNLFLKRDP